MGGPNGGKSQLLAALTRATPEVAPYPFTTRTPLPGMMPWEDVMVQLIDTPPITADFLEPYLQGMIRGADVALLLVDLASDDGIEQCQAVLDRLERTKTRLAKTSHLDEEDVGLSYTQTLVVPNKIDVPDAADRLGIVSRTLPAGLSRACDFGRTRDRAWRSLQDAIFQSLDVIRVYTKLPTAKEPDYEQPFTVRRGSTLLDMAGLVHKDFVEHLKFARIWGTGVHDGTRRQRGSCVARPGRRGTAHVGARD